VLVPYHVSRDVGLGGSVADTLNALASVPTTDGGRHVCTRDPSIRSSHFHTRWSQFVEPLLMRRTLLRCSRPWSTSSPGDYIFKSKRQVGVSICSLLGILNIITKSRLSFLILVTVPKMPNLSLIPLKPSCHPQHDMRDAVLKYAIALLNK